MDEVRGQRASLTVAASRFGFAVVYHLDSEDPAVLLHRQAKEKAHGQRDLMLKILVETHGWAVTGVEGETTFLERSSPLEP